MLRVLFFALVFCLSCSQQTPISPQREASSDFPAEQTTLSCNTTFDIELVILPGEVSLGSTHIELIELAASRWEAVITGDIPDASFVRDPVDEYSPFLESRVLIDDWIDDIRIFIRVKSLRANVAGSSWVSWIRTANRLPSVAEVAIDPSQLEDAQVEEGFFYNLVLHEIGHALGFGSTWADLDLVRSSTFGEKKYSNFYGAEARRVYRTLRRDEGNFGLVVPLSSDQKHWSPLIFGDELMTKGWTYPYNATFSALTVAAMSDIGYQVNWYAGDETYVLPPRRSSKAKPPSDTHTGHVCHVERRPARSR